MNFYLEKHGFWERLIETPASENLEIVVVIPCCNEPELLKSLDCLRACNLPEKDTEVIVIINSPENGDVEILDQNRQTQQEATTWAEQNSTPRLSFYVFNITLPFDDAGIGLARKIGMDEAVRRFEQIHHHDGIISCFDASTLCDDTYLQELEKHFMQNPKTPGVSIYFEHSLEGDRQTVPYEGIVHYELYMRYYINSLRYSGHPFAYQTIGSGMAVRSYAYQDQGGMNKRKTGEDFYFLHQIIELGNFSEINTTRIIPAIRLSDGAPFVTDNIMKEWMSTGELYYYDFRTFEELKIFFGMVEEFYYDESLRSTLDELPETVKAYFLTRRDFRSSMSRIAESSTGLASFRYHFFRWFNAFETLKYADFTSEFFFPKTDFEDSLELLFQKIAPQKNFATPKECLLYLRERDRGNYQGRI